MLLSLNEGLFAHNMTWKFLQKFRNVLSLSNCIVYSHAHKNSHSRENELDYHEEKLLTSQSEYLWQKDVDGIADSWIEITF